MSKQHKVNFKELIASEVAPNTHRTEPPAVAEEMRSTPTVVTQPAVAPMVETPTPAPVTPVRRSRQPPAPKGRGTIRDRATQMSIYLEPPVYDTIREIAHVERVKMHQLFLEGIDLLLKKRGSPSIKELMKKVEVSAT